MGFRPSKSKISSFRHFYFYFSSYFSEKSGKKIALVLFNFLWYFQIFLILLDMFNHFFYFVFLLFLKMKFATAEIGETLTAPYI